MDVVCTGNDNNKSLAIFRQKPGYFATCAASCSFKDAYVELKLEVNEEVKNEMSRLRTKGSLVPFFGSVTH